jgi:methionine-rich copper-binding protein CopC
MQVLTSRGLAVILLAACSMLVPSPAGAHAIIIAAAPVPGAVLPAATLPVRLRFNSRLDLARSRLTLICPDASTRTLPLDASAGPDMLVAQATGLVPGQYRLRWQVLGVDGHITRGDIPFEVAR